MTDTNEPQKTDDIIKFWCSNNYRLVLVKCGNQSFDLMSLKHIEFLKSPSGQHYVPLVTVEGTRVWLMELKASDASGAEENFYAYLKEIALEMGANADDV